MEPLPEDWKRAVAIVAHPDDLEYGIAGAIARWTAQGKEIAYVLATRGEAGIDGIPPDDAGPLREEEERRAAAIVGVGHVEFLGHPDGGVKYGLELRRDLAGAIRRLRPDILITMNFDLTWGLKGSVNHADHRAVGLAALDAGRDAGNRWLYPDLGEPWKGAKAAYVAGAEHPTHFVDVTKTIDTAVASLGAHKAYLDGLGGGFDPDRFLRGAAQSMGQAVGCDFAILFRRLTL